MTFPVEQLIYLLLTMLSHIGASLFFAKPRFGKAATAVIWRPSPTVWRPG